MKSKVIARLQSATQRRRDEADVRVHSDAGSLPTHHSHRAGPVRGGRQALAQIDAELTAPAAPEIDRVCTLETVSWLHGQIHHNEAEAKDLDSRALECMELAKRLRHRNADLRALLTVANPAEHVPGTDTAAAAPQPAPRPLPGSVDLLVMSRHAQDEIEPCEIRFFSYPVAIVARFYDAEGRQTGQTDHPVFWSASDLVKHYQVRGWHVASLRPPAAEPPRDVRSVGQPAPRPDSTLVDVGSLPAGPWLTSRPDDTLTDLYSVDGHSGSWWTRPLENGDVDELAALDGAL